MRRLALVVIAIGIGACDRAPSTNASPAASVDPNVHVLTLPDDDADPLPEGAGKSLTVGSCLTCHSPRYIADQPVFPRKTWTAEVEKMKKTYGAPIDDGNVKPIVDYLVAAHGRED